MRERERDKNNNNECLVREGICTINEKRVSEGDSPITGRGSSQQRPTSMEPTTRYNTGCGKVPSLAYERRKLLFHCLGLDSLRYCQFEISLL